MSSMRVRTGVALSLVVFLGALAPAAGGDRYLVEVGPPYTLPGCRHCRAPA